MMTNFLNFIMYGGYVVSQNNPNLLTLGSVTFNTDGSYNTETFMSQSLEIYTTGAQQKITVTIDAYSFDVNPGCYLLKNIAGARMITIAGSDQVQVNVYQAALPEKLVQLALPASFTGTRAINYKSNGLYETLIMYFNGTQFYWQGGQKAPFNFGGYTPVSTPVLVLPSSTQRLHLALFSNFIIVDGSNVQAIDMYYGTDLGSWLGPGLGYSGSNWSVITGGNLFFDAPVFRGDIYVAFDFAFGMNFTPTTRNYTPGYFVAEEHLS